MKRYLVLMALLLAISGIMSIPGVTLLNQEYRWYPTQSGIHGIEINGRPISNSSVIRYSICFALALSITAMICFGIAVRNWRANKSMLGAISDRGKAEVLSV